MTSLFLLIAIGAVLWFWQQSLRAREIAVRAAHDLCQRQGLQLLDSTVVLSGLRLQRSDDGWLRLQRTYLFEYSRDGDRRERGFILVLGLRLETVGLAAEM